MIRTIILAAFGATLILLALRSLRANRLKERYALLVGLMGLPFVGLAAWPDAVVFLAEKMQIEKPTFLLMVLAGFLILMIIQLLSLVSVLERKMTALTQQVGTLKSDHLAMERRLENIGPNSVSITQRAPVNQPPGGSPLKPLSIDPQNPPFQSSDP